MNLEQEPGWPEIRIPTAFPSSEVIARNELLLVHAGLQGLRGDMVSADEFCDFPALPCRGEKEGETAPVSITSRNSRQLSMAFLGPDNAFEGGYNLDDNELTTYEMSDKGVVSQSIRHDDPAYAGSLRDMRTWLMRYSSARRHMR